MTQNVVSFTQNQLKLKCNCKKKKGSENNSSALMQL